MKEKEIVALLNLLDDPDENIYLSVRDKLLNHGSEIISKLEKAWEYSSEDIVQHRIEAIIQTIQFDEIKSNLLHWKEKDQDNLLYGVFLIAKFQYPELKYDDILKKIENIEKEIWIELNQNLTALEKVKVLNHVLFKVLGFKRNISNPASPQNAFINDIISTKKGNQVSISILYAIIAQELKLPIYGVNLPSTFILAYKDELSMIQNFETGFDDDILFYINPYNRGAVFGKKEIDYFLQQQKIEPQDKYYSTCNNAKALERLIKTLIDSYEKLGYAEKVQNLNTLLHILIDN